MNPGENHALLYADRKRIQLDSWNIGHGNKILHLLFLLNLAEKSGASPVIPCESSLDEIFDLSNIRNEVQEKDTGECIYTETTAFPSLRGMQKLIAKFGIRPMTEKNLFAAIQQSSLQAEEELDLLNSNLQLKGKGYVRGHFWHHGLMPGEEVFLKYVRVKPSLIAQCLKAYPGIENPEAVMVHLRDTDFRDHLRHVFKTPITLPEEYYQQAIALTEKLLGSNLTYHLFSDNPEKITSLFRGRKFVMHNNPAPMDWACIYLGKNVIQSNSSFCWTASLFGKQFSIQPKGGYNWARADKGSVPFGFRMPFSREIAC